MVGEWEGGVIGKGKCSVRLVVSIGLVKKKERNEEQIEGGMIGTRGGGRQFA